MSKVVCIPCINMEIDERFLIHGTSDRICSMCGGGRGDGLVISIISPQSWKQYKEEILSDTKRNI